MLSQFKKTQTILRATKLTEMIRFNLKEEFYSYINELMQPGDICSTVDSNGEIPLNLCILRNRTEFLTILLEFDLNLKAKDAKSFSPLHYALLLGHLKLAQTFINKGADVNEICQQRTKKTLLHKMISCNKLDAVRLLLENNATVNKCDATGMTPLDVAVIGGHKQIVSLLLEFKAKINYVNESDNTSLDIAIQTNQPEICKLLINNGADLLRRDGFNRTPLYTAATYGRAEICKQILKQTRETLDTKESLLGRTPLHMACGVKSYPVVNVLLQHGANEGMLTKYHKYPINIALETGCMDIVKLFGDLSDKRASKSTQQSSAILRAIDGDNPQILQCIMNYGDNFDTRDVRGCTPLHYATQNGKFQCIKFLVEHDANIDAKDEMLRTPLHYAYIYGFEKIARYLSSSGANQQSLDIFGHIPLHYRSKVTKKM